MPYIAAPLIVNHLATLRELEEYYSLKDAFDLLEVLRVQTYNEEISAKRARREQKQRQPAP